MLVEKGDICLSEQDWWWSNLPVPVYSGASRNQMVQAV